MAKKKIAIVFGGVSPEHEVSLSSARNVLEYLDRTKFDALEVGIAQDGRWYIGKGAWGEVFKLAQASKFPADLKKVDPNTLSKFEGQISKTGLPDGALFSGIDAALPLTHGPNGEDGTVQAVFQLLKIPIIGCGVGSSAACMNKNYTKAVAAFYGVPVVASLTLAGNDLAQGEKHILDTVRAKFADAKLFVKPVASGSSFGASKVEDRSQLRSAIELALQYSEKALIEEFIDAREIFVAVIGPEKSGELFMSPPGEVIPSQAVYDYADKYQLGTEVLQCPALLPDDVSKEIQRLAKLSYRALECSGFARIDLFFDKQSKRVYLNEINTIPGMTAMSHFPKALSANGLKLGDIITKLINCTLL